MKRKSLAVIPARYKSSRFEGKPLAMLHNKPMVMHVYDAACASNLFDRVVVATDDTRIFAVVKEYGGDYVMTSSTLRNGTERVAQTAEILEKENPNEHYDIIINVQGDEPLIKKEILSLLIDGFSGDNADIVTLKKAITDIEDIKDPNVVKVVAANDRALYFSRSAVPFNRDEKLENLLDKGIYYKHIGIYGYKSEVLKKIVTLEESKLEKTEKLEQLRWLENGYNIVAMTTIWDTIGVDTPQDLEKAEQLMNSQNR